MTYTDLIQHYKTQAAAARALNLSQPSVCAWKDTTIPYGRQHQIQSLTRGRLKARVEDDARLGKKAA